VHVIRSIQNIYITCSPFFQITNLAYNADSGNEFILASTGKPAEIVKWNFTYFQSDSVWKASNFPETITGKGTYYIV